MTNKLILLALCVTFYTATHAANILGIQTCASRSVYIFAQPLYRKLANSGHNVTVLTIFKSDNLPENYHEIVFAQPKALNDLDAAFQNASMWGQIKLMAKTPEIMRESARSFLNDRRLQNLLKSDITFDLILMSFVEPSVFLALAHRYSAPVIVISTNAMNSFVSDYSATPVPHAFVPHLMLPYKSEMNFWQRATNTIVSVLVDATLFARDYFYQQLNAEFFPESNKTVWELKRTVSPLTFSNSHVTMDRAQALMTNVIEVSGMQIEPPKPLPNELQKFMDGATTEGIVYFCLGSNVKPKDLSYEAKQGIVKALNGLKQKIVWKWDDPSGDTVDKNKFFTSKWLPQSDILAHPNVKLFVTHAGLLGSQEATYHGVPMVAIPHFFDQIANAEEYQRLEVSVSVAKDNLTFSSMNWALNEVLGNGNYSRNIKKMSQLLKDRQNTPLKTATFWVEYVMRHKGAYFLQSPALKLNTIEYHNLDVYSIFMGIALITFYLEYRFIKFLICNCCFKRKVGKVSAEKEKKDK